MSTASNVSDEDFDFVTNSSWMIRPCNLYKLEKKNCMSMKGRFEQYYVDGKLADCDPWVRDFINCQKWDYSEDYIAAKKIIQSEMKRVEERMTNHKNNDVWKPRLTRPPPNWNSPLPEHILEKQRGSYLSAVVNDAEYEGAKDKRTCAIS